MSDWLKEEDVPRAAPRRAGEPAWLVVGLLTLLLVGAVVNSCQQLLHP